MISMSKGFSLGTKVIGKNEDMTWKMDIRVACGTNEVEASVHAEISLLVPLWLLLLAHVGFMLIVNELDDGKPGITVVDVVSESRGVDDSQLDLELTLLQLGLDNLHLGELVQLLVMALVVVFGR